MTAPAFYRGSSLKKCIVVKHLGREEITGDGTCSKSPPLKRLCQEVQVCSWWDERGVLLHGLDTRKLVSAKPLQWFPECSFSDSCSCFHPSLLMLPREWSEKRFLFLTKILSLLLPLTPSQAPSPQHPWVHLQSH